VRGRVVCLVLLAWSAALVGRGAVITGTVVDGDGQPVAGAKVWLYYPHTNGEFDWGLVAVGETAADGSFALEDPERDPPLPEDHHWYVYACREGLALGGAETADPTRPLAPSLLEPVAVPGTITDTGGKPLARVQVTIISASVGEWGEPGHRSLSVPPEVALACGTTTDAVGAFTFRGLAPEWRGVFEVSAEGYGRLTVSGTNALTALAALALAPAGRFTGRIVGVEDPGLVSGARILADAHPGGGTLSARGTATVDDAGRVACADLPPAVYDVWVTKQPAGPYHIRGKQGVEVRSGEETTLELVAERAVTVTGRVVSADTGESVEGASIRLSQRTTSYYSTEGKAGADGRFAIACLPGATTVEAGGAEGYVGTSAGKGPTLEVGPEGATCPDLRLDRAYTLSVQVTDEAGAPVGDATLTVEVGGQPFARKAVSNERGAVEVERLPPGAVTVSAQKGDLASEPARVDVGRHEGPLTLVMKPGVASSMVAVVVDQNGAAVQNAQVVLSEEGERSRRDLPCPPPDETGRIARQGLSASLTYQLRLEAPGCDPYESERWTAEAGVTHDLGTVVLTRHTAVVGGVVVDEAGRPVAGVQVYNTGDAPAPVHGTTDAEGRFRLEGLREGPVYVFVDAPGCCFVGVPAQTGTEDVRITLQPKTPGTMGEVAPLRPPLPPEEARPLARQLLLDTLAQTQGGDGYFRGRLLGRLAILDAPAAFEAAAAGGDDDAAVKRAIALQHLTDDPDEALALLRETTPPDQLAWKLVDVARKLPADVPEVAAWLLQEAQAALPAVAEGPWRILNTALVGRQMRDFDGERGTALLRQAQQEAARLDATELAAYARGVVAENLCELDLEGALALVDPIADPFESSRHLGNIARRIARTDPERALKLIEGVGTGFEDAQVLARVLPFFPPDHFEEAVAAARGIEDTRCRPMALAQLATVGPVERRAELLEENAEGLIARGAQERGSGLGSPAQAMAYLACVARRLGYDQYGELALRAFALGAGGPQRGSSPGDATRDELALARLIAFTAPDAARHSIRRALGRAGGVQAVPAYSYQTLAAGAGEVDVRWALDLLAEMPPDDPTGDDLPRAGAVLEVVSRLLDEPEQRERALLVGSGQWAWLPVDEDS